MDAVFEFAVHEQSEIWTSLPQFYEDLAPRIVRILKSSLVPRRKKDERAPGVYCTRMRVISTAKPRVWEGSARG